MMKWVGVGWMGVGDTDSLDVLAVARGEGGGAEAKVAEADPREVEDLRDGMVRIIGSRYSVPSDHSPPRETAQRVSASSN
jgi:hypothetical protein